MGLLLRPGPPTPGKMPGTEQMRCQCFSGAADSPGAFPVPALCQTPPENRFEAGIADRKALCHVVYAQVKY